MVDFHDERQLRAPRLSALRLRTLLSAASDPGARRLLAVFLSDPWQVQGTAEYYAHELDTAGQVPRHLVDLRHAGWLHQRVAPLGLVSWLRRDDLTLRYPDVMASLREPAHVVRPAEAEWLLYRLRMLSGRI